MTAWRDVPTGIPTRCRRSRCRTAAGRVLRLRRGTTRTTPRTTPATTGRPASSEAPGRPRRPRHRGRAAWRRSRSAAGESFADLRMPEPYTPSAPTGVGTDDYRCFLLDPKLAKDAFLTGARRAAGQPRRRPPRDHVPGPARRGRAARSRPTRPPRARAGPASAAPASARRGSRWTRRRGSVPGRRAAAERCTARASASRSAAGTQVIMQVHYNLLAGAEPDTSAARLRLAPGTAADEVPRDGAAARPGRAALPARQDRQAVQPRRRGEGRQGPLRRGPGLPGRPAAPAVRRRRHRARADLRPPGEPGDDDPRRRRSHAPARPLDLDRGQRDRRGARHPGLGLRQPEEPPGEAGAR